MTDLICTNCWSRYRPGTTRCRRCKLPLVDPSAGLRRTSPATHAALDPSGAMQRDDGGRTVVLPMPSRIRLLAAAFLGFVIAGVTIGDVAAHSHRAHTPSGISSTITRP